MTKVFAGAAMIAIAAGAACADFVATMPPHLSAFNGSTRGYWFQAPVDFKMTGVKVLLPTGSTNQFSNFAVVRFQNNTPPPLFSATTNAFDSLATHLNVDPANYTPVNIDVFAGEIIGVYGNSMVSSGATTGTNSYANAPGGNFTEIFGNQVALRRSGMQFHLGSANPLNSMMHDVWSEGTTNTSNITRVEFTYNVIPAPGAAGLLGLAGLAAFRRRR